MKYYAWNFKMFLNIVYIFLLFTSHIQRKNPRTFFLQLKSKVKKRKNLLMYNFYPNQHFIKIRHMEMEKILSGKFAT